MIEMKRVDARARTLANDEIDAEVFHGRIEDFLNGGLEAVDLVEKENFAKFKGSENGGEVAFALEKRASAGFDGHVEFVGEDLGEGSLAETGRTVEEDVVEGLFTIASGFESNGDVFLDALLADVFGESFRANAGVDARIVVPGSAGHDAGGAIGVECSV
jgi:hypothetical protein